MDQISVDNNFSELILACKNAAGYSVDTRGLKQGDVFFALKGAKVDGHQFLEQAYKNGASCAVVSNEYKGQDFGLKLLKVKDPLRAMQDLASHRLSCGCMKIAAVTGSIGKTTTKDFLSTLLQTKYRTASSPGNSNSQIGLALSILNHVKGDEEVLVLEMGMTHPGNITRLVEMATPDVALITGVALAHAGNFESIDEIARAKAEIFLHPKTKVGVLSREIGNFDELCSFGTCKKLSFSTVSKEADFYASVVDGEVFVTEKGSSRPISLGSLAVPGEHNVHNLLGAVAVARVFGVDWEDIRLAVKRLKLPEMRLQFVMKNGVLFVNDSYNASEVTVKAALKSLPLPEKGGRKIAVLGEMLELGKFSSACHTNVALFALNYVDKMYCFGSECLPIYEIWKREGRPARLFADQTELIEQLKQDVFPGDVVLLKGSRSKQMWKVLEGF